MSTTVDDILADLQKFYSKKLNPAQLARYGAELEKLDEDVLCKAIFAVEDKEVVFPTVFIIRRHYNEVAESQAAQQNYKAPIFADLERNANRTTHGRESMRLMVDFKNGKFDREQYLAIMLAMEEKYPGVGWKGNAHSLKKFWDSEPRRYAIGREYLERIWRLQDAAGMTVYNSPEWYLESLKMDIRRD